MELHFVKLVFTFTLKADLSDPYLLFGCRAQFDAAFRNAVGCRRGDCTGCRQGEGCPYPANFGQTLARDPDAVRRHQKPPLPFVFSFPLLPKVPNRGATLTCSLQLFGNAVLYAHHYVSAVRLLMGGLGASVSAVEAECPGGDKTPVNDVAQPALPLLSGLDPTGAGPLSPDGLSITFTTPLRLMSEGRLMKQVSFANIARALMRRVSALAYYYEGAEPELDYRWLSQRSDSVQIASSDCRFLLWGGRPAGISGTLSFRGELEPFHLLLQLGLATQLGKGASFGFGAYRID